MQPPRKALLDACIYNYNTYICIHLYVYIAIYFVYFYIIKYSNIQYYFSYYITIVSLYHNIYTLYWITHYCLLNSCLSFLCVVLRCWLFFFFFLLYAVNNCIVFIICLAHRGFFYTTKAPLLRRKGSKALTHPVKLWTHTSPASRPGRALAVQDAAAPTPPC